MATDNISSWPSFSAEEADAARDVIASNHVNYWTGIAGREFEKEYAHWIGTSKAIALANGTLALDLALVALGIGPGDEVIVTPRTFIASVSSVVSAGAIPVFVDVDHDSGNISPETIKPAITEKTRAIIPVHLGGWPCDMDGIMALAKKHNLFVIEDCAQAHGAKIDGGEGGLVTTDDEELWSRMWSYKDHGKSWDAVYNRKHPPGFRWLHESFGTNWRMLEIQAAIGRIQISKMEEWTRLRTRNADALQDVFRSFPETVRCPAPDSRYTHAYYRQYAYIMPDGLKSGWTRDRVVEDIVAQGYPAFQGSCSEVYLEKAFDGTDWRPGKRLPVALELGANSMMFLTHPTINEQQLENYCKAIGTTLEKSTR